ncbi:transglycosylase SLT domain-containing protein [Enterobacter roggenkampii]|uniref:transglycosylase SLT domain-containing protein n=1 Tax=Enterobacter roggenkampii TaxID=1812935 RepID=UPI002E281677|nr:transglycosylase SLT domain-containing protein [Enterobacter roggenkampii]MED5757798.1 transglycosylase SLT domain-containing protein [Enterobacter roggenkampii]
MTETIRDYLVSLGFDIDSSGQAKFEATLKGVAANVVKLGAVVESTALAVVGFTTSIANGMDKLYWASQRTGASVNGIKALGYAASQAGSSAEAAQNSLESLARFMRSNPGAEGFLNRLGVQTRDASGQMRDMSAIFTGVGQRLSSMPYYRANQYAQMLGIDENTLMAMRRGLSGFSTEYQSMMQKTGFNADKAAIQSNKFMTSMRSFVSLLGILRDKVGSNLADGLSGTLDNLSKRMLENWPKIEEVVTKVVRGVLWAADAIGRVAWRITQAVDSLIIWFRKLSPAVQELIGLFAVLISGWRLLNTEFLKSPIGIVLALGAAIFALIEDYQTWKEGGKSLIAWDKWEPEIKAAIKSLGKLRDSVAAIGTEIARLLNIDLKNWSLKGDIDNLTKQFGEFGKMMSVIGDLINAIKDGNWKHAYTIGKQLWSQGEEQPSSIPAVVDSANSSAEWVKEKTGFDPRSIGRWFFGKSEPDHNAPNAERRDVSEVRYNQAPYTDSNLKSDRQNERRDPQIDELNGTQERSRKEAAEYHDRSTGVLGKIADGIKQIADSFIPMAGAAPLPPTQGNSFPVPEVKQPQASAQGKVLLNWMQPMFARLESLYRLPEGLLKSVAITESGGNQFAMSGAGAKGLFQFMDGTARDMGLRGNDVFDPMKSAEAAAKYLNQLLKQNGGDLSKTLASYNWGIGNVQRYGMELMPQETRNYIPKVMSNMPGGAQLSQETTINIYGANDPASTGREVADRQSGVNSRLTQQLQPRVY